MILARMHGAGLRGLPAFLSIVVIAELTHPPSGLSLSLSLSPYRHRIRITLRLRIGIRIRISA